MGGQPHCSLLCGDDAWTEGGGDSLRVGVRPQGNCQASGQLPHAKAQRRQDLRAVRGVAGEIREKRLDKLTTDSVLVYHIG